MNYENIPKEAIEISKQNDMFRQYIINLNLTIEWYNQIRRTTKEVEFELIEHEIEGIDKLIILGQTNLNWNSPGNNVQLFNFAAQFYW